MTDAMTPAHQTLARAFLTVGAFALFLGFIAFGRVTPFAVCLLGLLTLLVAKP
jgi:polyferredoxin